jgi:hypothetical protein
MGPLMAAFNAIARDASVVTAAHRLPLAEDARRA